MLLRLRNQASASFVVQAGVRIVRARGNAAGDSTRSYETRDVVDVPIGMVVAQTILQPQQRLDTESSA